MNIVMQKIDKNEFIDKIYTACRTCYSEQGCDSIYMTVNNVGEDKKLKLIKHVIDSGHHSTIECCSITFFIDGISRSCAQQLTRHRINSFSMKSQRYVTLENGKFDYVTPSTISINEAALKIFEECMQHDSAAYQKLIELGISAEHARAVLPNACTTSIVWTTNLRELILICNARMCTCAEAEIRKLITTVANIVSEQLPFLKPYLVPKCEALGYCNESKQRSCGRKYTKDVIFGSLEVYN